MTGNGYRLLPFGNVAAANKWMMGDAGSIDIDPLKYDVVSFSTHERFDPNGRTSVISLGVILLVREKENGNTQQGV